MSPILDNESSKSHRDSYEIDLDSCAEGNKVDHYSEGLASDILFAVFVEDYANSDTVAEHHTGWYS
jgi:hypothetical protein